MLVFDCFDYVDQLYRNITTVTAHLLLAITIRICQFAINTTGSINKLDACHTRRIIITAGALASVLSVTNSYIETRLFYYFVALVNTELDELLSVYVRVL